MADYEQILVDDDGEGVVTATLNRPDRMNAYTWRLGLELRHAIVAADEREDVRAIVVTGAGRAFCAGADLSPEGGGFQAPTKEQREERKAVTAALREDGPHYSRMATPIIAAMNGSAVGVGMTLPMVWDLRIANEDAKYGFVFNRRGVIPELNAPFLLPRIVGVERAMDLLLTGRTFTGREAAAMGVVSQAVPGDEVLPTALALAKDIAANVAPVSAALVKRLIYKGLEQDDVAAAEELNHRLFGWAASQPDAVEGPTAFLQKRPPAWQGRKHADFPSHLLEDA